MSEHKPGQLRGDAARRHILDAAERLLAEGEADFSMRDLADAAGVSFATPFNLFGGKTGIMHALSDRRIDRMHALLAENADGSDAAARVLRGVAIAVGVMAAAPAVNRAVMASLGSPGAVAGAVLARSRAFWGEALGGGAGLKPETAEHALATLPDALALAFRGALSFWTAGEIDEHLLAEQARAAASALLFGFVDAEKERPSRTAR